MDSSTCLWTLLGTNWSLTIFFSLTFSVVHKIFKFVLTHHSFIHTHHIYTQWSCPWLSLNVLLSVIHTIHNRSYPSVYPYRVHQHWKVLILVRLLTSPGMSLIYWLMSSHRALPSLWGPSSCPAITLGGGNSLTSCNVIFREVLLHSSRKPPYVWTA